MSSHSERSTTSETYTSGWFDVKNATEYTITHNLNSINVVIELFFLDTLNLLGGGANKVYQINTYHDSGSTYGAIVREILLQTVDVQTGASGCAFTIGSDGVVDIASHATMAGRMKVIVKWCRR